MEGKLGKEAERENLLFLKKLSFHIGVDITYGYLLPFQERDFLYASLVFI